MIYSIVDQNLLSRHTAGSYFLALPLILLSNIRSLLYILSNMHKKSGFHYFQVCTIMLCFFISTLFSRANIAAAAGGVIFFCFYLPYSFLVVWEESLSSDFKIISVSLF